MFKKTACKNSLIDRLFCFTPIFLRKLSNKKAFTIAAVFFAVFVLTAAIVVAADGSGTNTVNPTSVNVGSTGNTETFTFTAAETMDSGGMTITVPSGWTAPQGVNGSAGYTTGTSTGALADIVNNLDSTTSWNVTSHMALSADTGDKQEGTASLSNAITSQAAANEQWYFNYGGATTWGNRTDGDNLEVGMWLKSSVNTASGDFSWQDDNTASLASPLDTVSIPALTANTWTYTSVPLGATSRTSQLSYGFRYTNDIGAATLKADSLSVIFHDCDANAGWSGDSNISDSLITGAGNFMEGTGSVRCTYAAGAGIGTSGDCWDNEGSVVIVGAGTKVNFWVRSSVALNAGDFAWVDDNQANLANVDDAVSLPAISANTWTYVTLTAANSADMRSFGLRQVVDKGAMTIDIDAIGKEINTADSTTGWTVPTAIVQTVSTDAVVKHEGTNSLKNDIMSDAAVGDKWYQTFGSAQNWSGYTTVGFWIRSTVATTAGQLKFEYSSASDLTSPIASINIGALSANTWTYQKLTLAGTRTTVNSYGINYATDIGAATVYLDDVLIGPGSITFPGSSVINARILSLANTETITITYGAGGGTSGAAAPSAAEVSTFTTQSRASDAGTLTNIASSPTVSVNNPVPTTTSISPTSKTVGDTGFTLTVNGTNFVSASVVNFAGSARSTTYVNSTQLTASILTSDLTTAGTFNITVTNPTPGGGTSNAQTLTVNVATSKFVIIDPTDGTVDASITITVQAQKTDNSIDTAYQADVTLNTTGSATGGGVVDIINGIGTINISDTVAETVNLSLTDSQSTGLDITSTQSVIFSPGAIENYSLNDVVNMYARTRAAYVVSRSDQYSNLVSTGASTIYLYSSSVSSTKKFYDAATNGNIITSINIADGQTSASVWYYDEEAGTYTITASDNASTPDGTTGINDGTDSIIVLPVATKFVIIDPADGTVDAQITVTVQAQKPDNSVDTNYQTDVTLNTSGSATGGGVVNIINGEGTLDISDTVAETVNLSLTDSQSTGLDITSTQSVVFAGGALSQFSLNDPGTLTAGSRIGYTVTRKDQYNNLTTSGLSTVYLYSSSLGANKKFYDAATNGNIITSINITNGNSTADFWYYDEAPGTYTITASDNASTPDGNTNVNDASDSLDVIAGSVSQFALNDPGDVYIDTRVGYTVTRKDQFNNLASSGSNAVYLYSSSGGGIFYDAASGGNSITSINITNGNSTANFWYSDSTPGTYTITASDNSSSPDGVTGIVDATDSVTISNVPIVATRFVILNPTDGTVDNSIAVTVQAQDNSSNIDTTYQTDVTLNTSGSATGGGVVNIINGVGTINISNTVAETVNLSLTDSQGTGLDVTSTQDVIFSVGNVSQFSLDNPGDMVAGTRLGYIVTRKDQFGNLVTSGLTTAYLYGVPSSINKKFYDAATAGSIITFVNITNGNSSANFWYYDETAATSTVVASDNVTAPDSAGIVDASDQVIVSAGAAATFVLNDPGDMTASTRLGYTVSRQDQFGNSVTLGITLAYLYTSSTGANAKFYDSATGGLVVTAIAIDDGNSSANFWYYDESAGTWNVTVSDSTPTANGNTGIIDDVDSVVVSNIPIVATRFVIINPGNSNVGNPLSVNIQAQDNAGNIDTTYQNDVTLNLTGSATGGGLIDIANGVATIQINDAIAETVILSLSDTQSTGLNVTSTQQAVFSIVSTFNVGAAQPVNVVLPRVGKVSFSGLAYPQASLSMVAVTASGDQTIKNDTASSNGSFAIEFSGLSFGSRSYALRIQDKDGREAQIRIFDLNLINANSELSVNDIIASPTIGFPRANITRGDFLAVVGYATPGSSLNIVIDGQSVDASVIAGADGSYRYLYNTASLILGSHTIRVRQIMSNGTASEYSPQKIFFTTNLTVPQTDFNNDGKINISDWSIFLARWFSSDPTLRLLNDFNKDGKIDATDFSIFIRTLRQ